MARTRTKSDRRPPTTVPHDSVSIERNQGTGDDLPLPRRPAERFVRLSVQRHISPIFNDHALRVLDPEVRALLSPLWGYLVSAIDSMEDSPRRSYYSCAVLELMDVIRSLRIASTHAKMPLLSISAGGGCFTRVLREIGYDVPYITVATVDDVAVVSDKLCRGFVLRAPSGREHLLAPLTRELGWIRVDCDEHFEHAFSAVNLCERGSECEPYILCPGVTPADLGTASCFALTRASSGLVVNLAADNGAKPSASGVPASSNRSERNKRRKAAKAKAKEEAKDADLSMRAYRNTKDLTRIAERQGESDLGRLANKLSVQLAELRAGAKENGVPFSASNFLAKNYLATALPTEIKAVMEGKQIPASDASSAIALVQDILAGKAVPPKRFGDDSFMMKTTANAIISLSALTAGNDVIVVTPMTACYKGALVFQIAPGSTSPSILGYVAPDRDPEEFSTKVACSYAALSISAPLVVGGTAVTVAQMTVESAQTYVSPLSSITGKLAAIAVGRKADHEIVGPNKHTVAAFTADMPDFVVMRNSSTDQQNDSLVRIPNAANQQTVGQLVSTPARCARFAANSPIDAGSGLAAGFVSGFNDSSPLVIAATTLTTIWNLKDSTDFLRHMLYGHFTVRSSVTASAASGAATELTAYLRVTYSDGSTAQFGAHAAPLGIGDFGHVDLNFNTRGNSVFESKTGLFITNMEWRLYSTVQFTASKPTIDIVFEDVSMDTHYLAHVISGAVSQAKINVAMETYSECFPDPTTKAGKYLTPSEDLPYMTQHFPNAVRMLTHGPPVVYQGEQPYTANFWKDLKKVGKFVWEHGGEQVAMKALTSALAASFGSNAKKECPLGIAFPAVRDESVKLFEVTCGSGGDAPDFVTGLTSQGLTAGHGWIGESADFAFLLAALALEGWPIRQSPSRPLIVSGDVERLRSYGSEIVFDLYPVKEVEEKLQNQPENALIVGTDGFHMEPGQVGEVEFPANMIFGPSIGVTCIHYPGNQTAEGDWERLPYWRIAITKTKLPGDRQTVTQA